MIPKSVESFRVYFISLRVASPPRKAVGFPRYSEMQYQVAFWYRPTTYLPQRVLVERFLVCSHTVVTRCIESAELSRSPPLQPRFEPL